MSDLERIRNFCIVAHIDHGKSTLADRLIELTGTVAKRDMKEQLLDSMDIERERGITIKLTPTKMKYTKNGKEYILNLIDTPGHVDFTYEVSRSLAACEGAILIVDATQGVQAQTINNVYLAIENNLTILPVINKIDLSSARPEESKKEIEDIIGIDASSAPLISAKTGLNVNQVLDQIVDLIPSPKGDENGILKALIFDSYYDNYKGAICMVRLFDGKVKAGTKIYMMGSQKSFEVVEVGTFDPEPTPVSELKAGEVGYIAASIKTVNDCRDGDTITYDDNRLSTPLPGYKVIQPVVFSGIFLVDGSKFNELKDALEKLKLSDASLTFEQEVSAALGFGFRCGFLGLLHMDVITERLEREFNLDIITTAPSVNYRITKITGEVVYISNPSELPLMPQIQKWEEPFVKLEVYTPPDYVGPIMQLCQDRRGEFKDMQYLDKSRARITYEIPLNEIVYDFFDTLKSISKGYASMDYEFIDYRVGDLVKLDILLNNEVCDALSLIVHKDDAYNRGRSIVDKLKDLIPRQMFEVPVQAAIGGKIIARETVKAWRKDVLAKCYGGDVTRKRKLLEKQKEGKKRMRKVGTVELPAEAFISILKV
jgi:GTP-binding protein LepA